MGDSAFASCYSAGDEADAASDDGSLHLPDKTPVTPCRLIEPNPSSYRHDQQDDQDRLIEVSHVISASTNCLGKGMLHAHIQREKFRWDLLEKLPLRFDCCQSVDLLSFRVLVGEDLKPFW
ncbi:hypothetical protein [Synechococcus sp. MU1611]|uniref:hypothetical protein n=1 Tax=Synechococcus sp. MU1611 TaxID=2508345 RepID=UPI001CF92A6D|nr:hypothetical protein [Synechococcus sp. MU1611]